MMMLMATMLKCDEAECADEDARAYHDGVEVDDEDGQ
jgi:hypothetical protein